MTATLLIGAALTLSGCSSSPSIEGVWQADDGSGIKTIRGDGNCTGMYYNQGQPLDIGGTATCQLTDTPDDTGAYAIIVEQPPNQANYSVTFEGSDRMIVEFGSTTVELERQ